ncbi:hypothetical protein CY35_12G044900, partial [Sphagnum magellanicum]
YGCCFPAAALSSSSGSVSLRPGGGRAAAVSFRPFASSFLSDNGALSESLAQWVSSGGGSSRSERIRYTRDGLLRFQELWTQPPDELVEAGLAGLMSTGEDLLQEDDCTRRDPGGMGGPEPVALPAVVQQQQLQRTPNKQRNDRNERNERDRNENNSRGSKDQTNAQASLPPQQQQQPPQPPENNPLSEKRAVTTIAKAANPWSARRGAQSEKEKVFRTVKGILNKLTPEKYDVLLEQMMQAGISSAEILQGVISLIFDKAVLEPNFCSMYAQLCVNLSKELPEFPSEQAGEKPVTFRRVLLNTCQEEFEGADALRGKIKQMTESEQVRERADKEKLAKLRTLGNIKLIGELFKQKMLLEKIVHACIQELLGSDTKSAPAEENVEALCQLFSSFQGAKPCARIKFMVWDILDLWSNKWIPRREEVKAKRINEIHAEAEQKLGLHPGMVQMRNGQAANAPGHANMPGGYMPGAGGMPGAPLIRGYMVGLEADGWETVGMGTAAPTSRYGVPVVRGSGVGPRGLAQGSGGYGFLGKPSALIGNGTAQLNLLPRQSGYLAEPQGVLGPLIGSAQDTAKETVRSSPPAAQLQPAELPATDLSKKTLSLVDEYFSVVDHNEALLSIQELKAPDFHPELVDCECALVLKLLVHLNAEEVVSRQDLRGGVLQIAEQLEDIAMDAPRAPKKFGEMVAGFLGRSL